MKERKRNMGTLIDSIVFSHTVPGESEVFAEFGWDCNNATPAQVQAVVAVLAERRKTYLVDRHDEIWAGVVERICEALERLGGPR